MKNKRESYKNPASFLAGVLILIAMLAVSPSADAQLVVVPPSFLEPPIMNPNSIVNMTELPFQPVNGVTVKGFTFADTSGANFNAPNGGQLKFVQDPSTEGNTAGETITITTNRPVKEMGFGFALSTGGTVLNAATVTLFNGTTNLGTLNFTSNQFTAFTEGFPAIVSPVAFNTMVITFNSVAATAFGLDNVAAWTTAFWTGPVIQNTGAALNTPTFADFVVIGPSTTVGASNTVNSLTFIPGGTLTVNTGNTLHVTTNYTQVAGSTLAVQFGKSGHGLITIGGTAQLGGTLQLVAVGNPVINKPVTFLTATGGVTGTFSNVIDNFPSDTILDPTIIYSKGSVAFEASFGLFAQRNNLTPNQKAVAAALDVAAGDSRSEALFQYLDYRHLEDLPGDFDKIAPEELTSVFTLAMAQENVHSLNLQRRTEDIRSGSSGFSAANLAINGSNPSYSGAFGINTGVAGPSGNDGKEVKETKPIVPADNRWGVFLSGTGEWVTVGDTNNARGFTLESGGFTLGVDYKVTPNFAIGLAAGYTGTTADLTDHGRVWVNGGQIGLYATFFQNEQQPAPTMSKDSSKDMSKEAPAPAPSVAKGFYVDVAAFGGYNSYDTRRSALQGDEARGSTDGGEFNALFGTGYDFKAGGLTFGPTATFNYTYAGLNGFQEQGSLAPLNIHGGDAQSLRSAFGIKMSYDCKCGGVIVRPEVRAAWQHEFGDTAYNLTSSFASGAPGTFSVAGPQIGRESALLGAGFAVLFNERASAYVYYDGEVGRTDYHATNVTGGFRFAF